jgi:hypothetical protein
MKRIVFLTCIGSLALALTAWGAPNKPATKSPRKTVSAPSMSRGGGHAMSHAAPMRTSRGGGHAMSHVAPTKSSRGFSGARMRTSPIATNSARIHARNNVAVKHERSINRANTTALRNSRVNTQRNSRLEAAQSAKANAKFNRVEAARTANANANFGRGANGVVNRGGNIQGVTNQAAIPQTNTPIVNNWQNVSGQNYAAFRDYRRQWHDRNWWQNNYSRIILVGGGWWYWNSGYWYPAWGYDPYYTYYPYDGPIYGYGDLTPDRIIINVQTQLRNDGYYVGAIDGILGRQTRRAIAAFQADHGLAVTSAVDEPTLATLGLT